MIFNTAATKGGADVSGVTATAGDVLTGKVFVDSSGDEVNGSMANRGAVSGTIDGLTTTSYMIQQGYYNGSGIVSLTDDIEDTLDGMLNGPHYVGGIIFYEIISAGRNAQYTAIYAWIKAYTQLPFEDVFELMEGED